MKIFRSQINLDSLLTDCNKLNFHRDGTGILMAYAQSIEIKDLKEYPHIHSAVQEILNIHRFYISLSYRKPLYLMVNKIPPDIQAPMHTDTLKQPVERWHFVVFSNSESEWYDAENGTVWMKEGCWYGPISYNKPHAVGNFGLTERVHLIVDLERK